MERSRSALGFVRPALLEAVLLATTTGVAVVAIAFGMHTNCTALVEFGLLSAVAGASAATLLVRYAVELAGRVIGYASFERWGVRVRWYGYAALGLYALVNGVLDLVLPRHEVDAVSYAGLIWTVAALLIVTLVVLTKYRVLENRSSRSLIDSLVDDTFYLSTGTLIAVVLVGHVFAPAWWLDTATDAAFLLFVAYRMDRMRRSTGGGW